MRRKPRPTYVPLDDLPAGYTKRWLGFPVIRVVRPDAGKETPSRDPVHRLLQWWIQ